MRHVPRIGGRLMVLHFVVPGPPVPNERARKGRGGHWYTPQRTRNYRQLVAGAALANRPLTWPQHAKYTFRAELYFPDGRRRDWDNCGKGICDALNGILWDDDSQVHDGGCGKHIDRTNPRAEVTITVVA